jgi:hypothetical protein
MNFISSIAILYFVGAIVAGVGFSLGHSGASWLWRWKVRTRILVALSLVLAAVVGVYGNVLHREESELTFQADIDYTWPSVPIRVSSRPADGYTEETAAAIRVWNHSIGCELFVGEGTEAAAQVRVRAFDVMPCGKPFRDLHGSEAPDKKEGTWDCHDGTMEVLLNNPGDFETAFRSVFHGLGHTLRLAHDDVGVMAADIRLLTIVEPSRKDLEALRARYCPAGAR